MTDRSAPEVTYRPFRAHDAGDVTDTRAIIDEAFFIHRYVRRPVLLDSLLEVYLRGSLLVSSYAQVAVRDGRVIGVLMGRVSGEPRLAGAFRSALLVAGHMLRLAVVGFPERRSLRQFFAFNRTYRRLRRAATAPLTDELTLFAVEAEARGLGVGRSLYEGFLTRLREHGRKDFYLYTDTLSTYGFYERRGMTRAASEDLTVYLDGEPTVVGVYLYAGRV